MTPALTQLDVVVSRLEQVPPGEGRNFDVGGERIAVFHTRAGQVFATQAECPHKKGPLADGLVGGSTLICPLHAWKFDLTNGRAVFGNCGIKTYPARLDEANRIVVTLELSSPLSNATSP